MSSDSSPWEGERPREPNPHCSYNRSEAIQSTKGPTDREENPHRHKPAKGVFVSSLQPTIVFLTVCTEKRHHWLAQSDVHMILKQVWVDAKAWLVGRYLLMPDHLHLFCAPGYQPVPLDRWVSYWKREFSLHAQHDAAWCWQANHWDTRLRRGASYQAKWDYVVKNPVRKGLVARSEDWPFQGEINKLRWL